MNKIKLDARLLAAASLVTGDFVADVGTDHGFLPIYLFEQGAIRGAVASDIREAPLSRAKANIRAHLCGDVIKTELTPGLCGIEKYPVSDVIIAGMGGMTVTEILSAADFIKERRTHLILQPMQHVTETRLYLCKNGFLIDREALAFDDGKIYQIISAVYDGKKRELSDIEATLGAYNIEHNSEYPELYIRLCEKYISLLDVKLNGYEQAGIDGSSERALMEKIKNEKRITEEKWQA